MFQGSIVALVTPMDESGGVDEHALRGLLDWQLENGSQGLVIGGSTGESATLSENEFEGLLGTVIRHAEGTVPIIAGTGTAATSRTIERTRRAADAGADAALVVTPYYVRPMQSGLRAHFEAVAEASQIPLILYNVPSRTAVDLLPETVAALAHLDNVVAIKEAVADRRRIRELVDRCGERLNVLSGDDASCRAAMAEGATGVVSVAANLVPGPMDRLCRAAVRGDEAQADQIDEELRELFTLLAVETNPIPVKWAAFRMGLIGPGLRLPLLALDDTHRPGLDACLDRMGLLPD